MESRQIVGLRQSVAKKNSLEWTFWTQTVYLLNSLSIYEEGGRKLAIMQPPTGRLDNVDWCLSCEGCRIMPTRTVEECTELLSAPPATVGARQPSTSERETTRSNAIAHVIYTNRTNRFRVNCPARRTHRHFEL